MEDRWVNDFCSFLKLLEEYGKIGHSAMIGFFADGDGGFRPKFNINTDFQYVDSIEGGDGISMEQYFDAG